MGEAFFFFFFLKKKKDCKFEKLLFGNLEFCC